MKKYSVIYNCHNCNKWFELSFEFGEKADDKETCPNCGVWGAKKSTRLTPLAIDGGDSAASEQLSTPEVLSTLQGESTPTHRK